jgi:hypothetical protein
MINYEDWCSQRQGSLWQVSDTSEKGIRDKEILILCRASRNTFILIGSDGNRWQEAMGPHKMYQTLNNIIEDPKWPEPYEYFFIQKSFDIDKIINKTYQTLFMEKKR